MDEGFVVVSGLPGSGKSTLAQQLSPALGLPLLDKDTILERLFESKGVGDIEWRRSLSRESDCLLQMRAAELRGAVLVSHWHLPGMPSDHGTPTDWIYKLAYKVVNVNCECSAEVSAERFVNRKRHAGHLDSKRSRVEILASIRVIASFGRLDVGSRIDVDTSQPQIWMSCCERFKAPSPTPAPRIEPFWRPNRGYATNVEATSSHEAVRKAVEFFLQPERPAMMNSPPGETRMNRFRFAAFVPRCP